MDDETSGQSSADGLPLPKHDKDAPGPLALIDKAAGTSSWRMAMARAAAQLIAGSERGATVYGEVRERLDTIEGRSTVSKALADAVAQQAVNDPLLIERAKARFLGTMQQKQVNLEAVIVGAQEQLLQLPAPADTADAADDTVYSASADPAQASVRDPLDPDWATSFAGLAENASSDDLRERLSKVLAGEIASPGTYSRATVRRIAELEKHDLEVVRGILPYVFGDMVMKLRGDEAEPSYALLTPLAEAGLITDASGTLSQAWPVSQDANRDLTLFGSQLVVRFRVEVGYQLSLGIFQITRTGLAVIDLLGRVDELPLLKRIAERAPPQWKHVGCARIVAKNDDGTSEIKLPWQELYPEPQPVNMPFHIGSSPFATPSL